MATPNSYRVPCVTWSLSSLKGKTQKHNNIRSAQEPCFGEFFCPQISQLSPRKNILFLYSFMTITNKYFHFCCFTGSHTSQ